MIIWLLLSLLLYVLIVLNDSSPLNRILIILAIDALAMTAAQNARLETLAVLLQTGRFLAGAPLCMLLLTCCTYLSAQQFAI